MSHNHNLFNLSISFKQHLQMHPGDKGGKGGGGECVGRGSLCAEKVWLEKGREEENHSLLFVFLFRLLSVPQISHTVLSIFCALVFCDWPTQ